MSTKLTPFQQRCAYGLAREFGHEWTRAIVDAWAVPNTVEDIEYVTQACLGDDWPGIRCPGFDGVGNVVHMTAGGRAGWEIGPTSGRAWINRPSHDRALLLEFEADGYAPNFVRWELAQGAEVRSGHAVTAQKLHSVFGVHTDVEIRSRERACWELSRIMAGQDALDGLAGEIVADPAVAGRCIALSCGRFQIDGDWFYAPASNRPPRTVCVARLNLVEITGDEAPVDPDDREESQ